MKKILWLLLLTFNSSFSYAEKDYQHGKIKNLTVTTNGIMIMLDSGVPDNCADSGYGWLLIKQEHTALTSVVLAAWASGNKAGTVYTTARQNGFAFCTVNQFDPVN